MLTAFVGCNKASGGAVIQYEGDRIPLNVDPLLASSDSELLAVAQLFEPLVTMQNGKILPAAAQDVSVSDDGKTYTFVLRDGLRWSDGQSVTASDFVFALQRAVDPATKAACSSRLLNIKGVSAVQKGKQPASSIGVQATNEKTLTVSLVSPDQGVLAALSGVAGMPCRQDFFLSCGGRYGMGKEYVIANGPFALSRWSTNEKDLYISLAKNEHYWNQQAVLPAGVTMSYRDSADRLARMQEGKADCAVIAGSDVKSATDAGVKTLSYAQDSYGLVMNTKQPHPTANLNLRKALVGGVDWSQLATYLPVWCAYSDSMMTPDQYCGESVYTATADYRGTMAQKADDWFATALTEIEAETLNGLELCYVEQEGVRGALDYLVQCWQKQFGLFVTLTAVSAEELTTKLQSGAFDLALCSMHNATLGTLETLEQFGSDRKTVYSGLCGKSYDKLLEQAKVDDLTAQRACEDYLRQQGIVIPLFYQKGYYAYRDAITGLSISSFNNCLDFCNVGKIG